MCLLKKEHETSSHKNGHKKWSRVRESAECYCAKKHIVACGHVLLSHDAHMRVMCMTTTWWIDAVIHIHERPRSAPCG